METAEKVTAMSRIIDGRMFRLSSRVLMEDPIIMHTMKQEKTRPKGQLPPAVSRMGVHRNTKMYMMGSNMDCTSPSNRIVSFWKMTRKPSEKDPLRLVWRLPWFSVHDIEMNIPLASRNGMAVMKGATGPNSKYSAPMSARIPDKMANTPFQKVEIEKVDDIHSLGKALCSVC